jgi:hypothetical protein
MPEPAALRRIADKLPCFKTSKRLELETFSMKLYVTDVPFSEKLQVETMSKDELFVALLRALTKWEGLPETGVECQL